MTSLGFSSQIAGHPTWTITWFEFTCRACDAKRRRTSSYKRVAIVDDNCGTRESMCVLSLPSQTASIVSETPYWSWNEPWIQ
jgi:hypothetical protein